MDDEMLVKFLLDEVTEDERAKVKGWISLEPANEKYFNHFELIWQQSKVLAASTAMDENAAWERFKKRVEKNSAPAIVVPFKKKFNWLRVAAVFIITFSVAM